MRRLATALIILTLVGVAVPVRADQADFPSITIDYITTLSGRCWDPSPGCGKPDYFVVVSLRNAQGDQVKCVASPVTENLLHPAAGYTLCNPIGATPTIKIRRPYSVIVELWDADGYPTPPATTSTTEFAQQADLNTGLPMHAVIGPFNAVGPSARAFVIEGFDARVGVSVSTIPVASHFRPSYPRLTPTKINPAIGEDVLITGELDDPTALTISAIALGTGAATLVAQLLATDSFNIRWDGRQSPGGPFLPTGTYRIDIVGGGGLSWSSPPLLLGPSPLLRFGSPRLETPSTVNVHAIVSRVSTSVPEITDATLEIVANIGGSCSGPALERLSFASLAPGRHFLEWKGRTTGGGWAPPGDYCLLLNGRRVSDGAAYVGAPPIEMVVEEQRPLFVDIRASPEIPALSPGRPVRVVARVFDDRGRPRAARIIRVSGGPFPSAPTPLGSCLETSECSIPLPGGVGIPTAAISAQAEDAQAELITFSPVRLVDLWPSGGDIRVSVATTTDGRTFAETPRRRAVDVVFHRALDFVGDDPTIPSFPAAVGSHMDAMLGYKSGDRGPSTIEANLQATNFWAVADPAVVEHTQSVENGATNLCHIAKATWSNSADVNAVIHMSACRDNARPGAYTAMAGGADIGWHELHHSPFGLYDEYCCDGGYRQQPLLPNVYMSRGDCQTFGSDPTTCTQISSATLMVPWFISDPPKDDVMSDNLRENADDIRKLRAHYIQCSVGGC